MLDSQSSVVICKGKLVCFIKYICEPLFWDYHININHVDNKLHILPFALPYEG